MKNWVKKFVFALATAACLVMAAGPATAELASEGTGYIEPQAGVYGTAQENVGVIVTYGANLGYFVIDGLSLGAELLGYYINQDFDQDANAFGVNFLVRFWPIRTDSFGLYIGTGIGGLFADTRVPSWDSGDRGDFNNWTLPVDVGVAINFADNLSLNLGGRYQRIGFTSPGVDAFGGHAGLEFTF